MAKFITTSQGGEKMIFDNFIYRKAKEDNGNGQIFWTCIYSRRTRVKCPGFAVTDAAKKNAAMTKEHTYTCSIISPTHVKLALADADADAPFKYAARGTLTLKVPSWNPHYDQYGGQEGIIASASILNIGNLKWHLELHKVKYANNYALYAKCNEECTDHFWFCNAKFTVYSKEGEEDKQKIVSTKPIYAFYGNNQLVIADAINLPPGRRQISLIVEVDILRVLPKMFALDTNIEVKMANGTKLVAVNKKGLASVSTYFDNFFFAEWREKGQAEFVLHEEDDPNFDIGTFQLMLYAALSLGWMVPELMNLFKEGTRMMAILRLAFKYDIPPLVEYCENQLILNRKKYPINFELLELADQLNLSKLLEHCLTKFKPRKFKKNISQTIGIRSRLGKNTLEKLDKILQKCAESTGHFTAKQTTILEASFYNASYISRVDRLDIAAETGLSDGQIRTWFQNRRIKARNQRRAQYAQPNLAGNN